MLKDVRILTKFSSNTLTVGDLYKARTGTSPVCLHACCTDCDDLSPGVNVVTWRRLLNLSC